VARANIIIPQLVNNPIFVGEGIAEETFEAIKRELMSFPDGEHDDFTDTLIDAVKWCYNRTPSILDVL
jgi:phage terminase large subunit-like protein